MASPCGWRLPLGLLLLTAGIVIDFRAVSAHEVPNDVLVQAYLKPESQRLRMLVRVPLISLRDMTWPLAEDGILDTSRAASELHNAATLWLGDEATMYDNGHALASPTVIALRATLPSDRSFDSYDQALALVTGPRPLGTDRIAIKEGFLDVLFEYPISSAHTRLSFQPRWGRLGVRALTRIQLLRPAGDVRVFELHGDPGLVHLDPTPTQVVMRFGPDGFRHLLDTSDYLLFLVCLVMPFRRPRQVVLIGLAVAIAGALTLSVSTLGMAPASLWFPSLISTLTAATIVYLSVENIAGTTLNRRWHAACALGLILGFAFFFALLPNQQFAGTHTFTSLAAFMAGIGLAQFVVLAAAAAVMSLLFRVAGSERVGVLVLSALATHTAWHWMTSRGWILVQYNFMPPEFTPGFFANVLRWLMVGVAMAGIAWGIGLTLAVDREKSTVDGR